MANDLTGNPLRCDTAATIITDTTGETRIMCLQWIDDAGAAGGALANADDLIMHINGILVQFVVTVVATQLSGAVAYSLEFPQPFRVSKLVVDTIDGGTVYVWKA